MLYTNAPEVAHALAWPSVAYLGGWTLSDVHPLLGDDKFFHHVIIHIAKIHTACCMRVEFKGKSDILFITATETLN